MNTPFFNIVFMGVMSFRVEEMFVSFIPHMQGCSL